MPTPVSYRETSCGGADTVRVAGQVGSGVGMELHALDTAAVRGRGRRCRTPRAPSGSPPGAVRREAFLRIAAGLRAATSMDWSTMGHR